MSNVIRDTRGVSDIEIYLRDAVREGRMISPEPVAFLLEEVRALRRLVHEEKHLTMRNEELRRQVSATYHDLQIVQDLVGKTVMRGAR